MAVMLSHKTCNFGSYGKFYCVLLFLIIYERTVINIRVLRKTAEKNTAAVCLPNARNMLERNKRTPLTEFVHDWAFLANDQRANGDYEVNNAHTFTRTSYIHIHIYTHDRPERTSCPFRGTHQLEK